MLYRTKFSFNFATIGCCNQWMQYLQLKVALLYCNQIVAGITISWLKQLKVADIATINCTSVALWLQIFAVHCTNVSTQIERHPLSERHPVFWVLHTMWLWHRKQRLEATGPTKGYKINHLLDNSQCPNFFNPFLLSN